MPGTRRKTGRIIRVFSDGWVRLDGRWLPVALGKGGVRADKREGDGATPTGLFPVRRLMRRADGRTGQMPAKTRLPVSAILASHGWCDAPDHAAYNRPVRHPFAPSHERMRRTDALYDLVLAIGHNDAPPVPGRGSAVFIHLAQPDFAGTEGCIALQRPDFQWMLSRLRPGDCFLISRQPAFAHRKSPTRPGPTWRQSALPVRNRRSSPC